MTQDDMFRMMFPHEQPWGLLPLILNGGGMGAYQMAKGRKLMPGDGGALSQASGTGFDGLLSQLYGGQGGLLGLIPMLYERAG